MTNIDTKNNKIIVGPKDALYVKKIILKDLNILGSLKNFDNPILIKIRSTGKLLRAKVNIKTSETEVEILEKEFGISPGQACVFYLKDNHGFRVLGGGWIKKNFIHLIHSLN